MNRSLICIICPRGCALTASGDKENLKIEGFACKRGKDYAKAECISPTRTVTSIVRVSNRQEMLSVKSEKPIPKDKIFEAMQLIRAAEVEAPIRIGDSVLEDVFGTDIIATKNIL